jgi:hypothetical protein
MKPLPSFPANPSPAAPFRGSASGSLKASDGGFHIAVKALKAAPEPDRFRARPFSCVPGMGIDLEVKVLRRIVSETAS